MKRGFMNAAEIDTVVRQSLHLRRLIAVYSEKKPVNQHHRHTLHLLHQANDALSGIIRCHQHEAAFRNLFQK